jgi:hypothetical protein
MLFVRMAIPLLRVPGTTKRPTMYFFHMFVRFAHLRESCQAEPAVVRLAVGTLDVEASVDSDARCFALGAEFAADTCKILAQSCVVWVATTLALFADFSAVELRFAGGAVDGQADWADHFVCSLDCGEVLVAVRCGAANELVRILSALRGDDILEERSICYWR